jgi:hypothetical protein
MNFKPVMAAVCLFCAPVFAVPGPCVKGTLADYIALGPGGCTVAGVAFTGFSYAPATTTAVLPSQILVTPSPVVFSPSLTFSSAKWRVNAGQTIQSVIGYSVAFFPPGSITSGGLLTLQLGPAQIGGIIGSVNVEEDTSVGNLTVFERCEEICTIKSTDQLKFSPIRPLAVKDHVTLTGGNGGASLSSFTVTYIFCPPCA